MILYDKDYIKVDRQNGTRRLWLNGQLMGRSLDSKPSVPISQFAIDIIHKIVSSKFKTVLCIGGGACLIPTKLVGLGLQVDIVEPNETILKLAEQYFQFDPNDHQVFMFKGEDFLFKPTMGPPHRYDAIVIDAYNDEQPVKEIYNQDYYDKCLSIINDNGLLIINDISNGGVSEFKKCIQSK